MLLDLPRTVIPPNTSKITPTTVIEASQRLSDQWFVRNLPTPPTPPKPQTPKVKLPKKQPQSTSKR